MPDNKQIWQRICTIEEIGEPGAFGFKVYAGKYPLFGFLVHSGGEIYGYKNVCPHAGRPLDWAPHRFLTKDKSQIMCSAHGALFEPDTGTCVAGPCLGRALKTWAVKSEGQDVYVEVPAEPVVR